MTRLIPRISFLCLMLLVVACSKTVVFKQEAGKSVPLKTDARVIRLHEDYLFAERDAQALKEKVVENIKRVMEQQQRFQFEFVPTGRRVPKNNSNNENIFLIGDIWMYKGSTTGNEVKKVTKRKVKRRLSQSCDELEKRTWKHDNLQTVVSLYFVEIGSKTKILRSTITISNDKRTKIQTGGRTISDRQYSQLYRDKEIQAGYEQVKSNSTITSTQKALDELARKVVTVHFDSL